MRSERKFGNRYREARNSNAQERRGAASKNRDNAMLNGKKIIVVLPAYNAERTLAKTVAELDRQVV